MSLEIKVPPVGESISEVTLSRWIKQDGDAVEMDEVIAELESDKATFELTAEKAGTLRTIAKEGDTLEIGAVVCTVEEGARSDTAPAAKQETATAPQSAGTGETIQIKVPPVGESITEVTLSSWLKADGDFVNMDEQIAELESDKATFELTAEKAGVLRRVAKEGDVLEIGSVVCNIEVGEGAGSASPKVSAPAEEQKPAVQSDKSSSYAAGTPSPSAAKILTE